MARRPRAPACWPRWGPEAQRRLPGDRSYCLIVHVQWISGYTLGLVRARVRCAGATGTDGHPPFEKRHRSEPASGASPGQGAAGFGPWGGWGASPRPMHQCSHRSRPLAGPLGHRPTTIPAPIYLCEVLLRSHRSRGANLGRGPEHQHTPGLHWARALRRGSIFLVLHTRGFRHIISRG